MKEMSSPIPSPSVPKDSPHPGSTDSPGNKAKLQVPNGKPAEFSANSASELLKTIIIASQASAVAQQKQLTKNMDDRTKLNGHQIYHLPADLQNFKGDPFMEQNAFSSQTDQGNSHQQQQPQQNHQQNTFILQRSPSNGSQMSPGDFSNTISPTTSMTSMMQQSFTSPDIMTNGSVSNSVNSNIGTQGDSVGHNSNLQKFQDLAHLNSHVQENTDMNFDKSSMLERLLTREASIDASFHATSPPMNQSLSSPDFAHDSPTSTSSSQYGDGSFMDVGQQPVQGYCENTNTQSSLITKSEKLTIDSFHSETNEDELNKLFEWNVTKIDDTELEHIQLSKNAKLQKMSHDISTTLSPSPSVEKVFDADIASQEIASEFKFSKFGQNDQFQFGAEGEPLQSPPPTPQTFKAPQPPHSVLSRKRDQARRSKEPILCQQFPSKINGYELRILSQPEEQHRARYLTEGSRGSVKNRSNQGYPVVKLFGHATEATLQIFIGCDSGRVRPHGFYQACKVCGKNSTPCVEKDIDGTTVIEIELKESNEMAASIDCVGILKLRNADVEQRIGIAKAKKKSTKARMIFRVTFQKPCGSPQVLQIASGPILCTQPVGQPEICKMSLKSSPATGGGELFIIGKNFLRGTRVFFQQPKDDEESQLVWEKEGDIDKDFFQTTHLIVNIPEYNFPVTPQGEVTCQVVVNSGGKLSDPQPFVYLPADQIVMKQEVAMDTTEESRKRMYPFVAPEALELNQQIQATQQVSKKPDMFQLPPGIISGSIPPEENYSLMEESNMNIDGTGFQNQPIGQEVFSIDTKDETMKKDCFSLSRNKFGQDTLDTTATQTWVTNTSDSVNNQSDNVSNKSRRDSTVDDVTYVSLNSDDMEDSFNEQHVDESFTPKQSPRPSAESFPTDKIGLISPTQPRDQNIVSQFLQNISMAMKASDPMMCNVASNQGKFANTTLTQARKNMVMSFDETHSPPPLQSGDGAYLKEALACPASSLQFEHMSNNIHVAPSSGADVELTEMETQPVKTVYLTEPTTSKPVTFQPEMNTTPFSSINNCSMSLSNRDHKLIFSIAANGQLSSTVDNSFTINLVDDDNNNNTESGPQETTNNFENAQFLQKHVDITSFADKPFTPTDGISFSQVFPVQSQPINVTSEPFSTPSPSDNRASNGNFQQFTHLNSSLASPAKQKKVQESHVQLTGLLNAPSVKLNLTPNSQPRFSIMPLSGGLTQAVPRSMGGVQPQNTPSVEAVSHQNLSGSTTLGGQISVPSNLQQALQNLQQTSQLQQQQQQVQMLLQQANYQLQPSPSLPVSVQNLAGLQQSVQPEPVSAPQNVQMGSQQQHFNPIASAQSPQVGNQTSPPVLSALQSYLAGQGLSVSSQAVPAAKPTNPNIGKPPSTLPTPSVQAPVPTPVVTSVPVGPQIIICNTPSQNAVTPQLGAPSIVIMPGQGGPNNQMENLLRSILGSMLPQQPPTTSH